jgi:hypothetical protein
VLAAKGLDVQRVKTPTGGVTDLYVTGSADIEIIEAKSSADHLYVRQALGQLLDYAPHSPEPATRLAGLFPHLPATTDVELLHRYGIDCIFRTSANTFERLDASDEQRVTMQSVWSAV